MTFNESLGIVAYLRRLIARVRGRGPQGWPGGWTGGAPGSRGKDPGSRGKDDDGPDPLVRVPRRFGPGGRSAVVALEEPISELQTKAIGRDGAWPQ